VAQEEELKNDYKEFQEFKQFKKIKKDVIKESQVQEPEQKDG